MHTHHAARCNGKMRDSYRIIGKPLGAGSYGQVFKCCFIESMVKRDAVAAEYQEKENHLYEQIQSKRISLVLHRQEPNEQNCDRVY